METFVKIYSDFKTNVVRTPQFPLSVINDLSVTVLKSFASDTKFQESIFIASPVLYGELIKWLSEEIKDEKEKERITISLMRYLLRMAGRCTPFGLFAGCSTAVTGSETTVMLKPQQEYKKHTRLDMHYLCALAQELSRIPEIKEQLTYYPNSSIYRSGEQLRYVQYSIKGNRRVHEIAAITYSEYVQKILDKAANGAGINEIVAAITGEKITKQMARAFTEEMLEAQVLVNNLEPAITGAEFLEQLMATLSKNQKAVESTAFNLLGELKNAIEKVNSSSVGLDIKIYEDIIEKIKGLKINFEPGMLFQTDMIKPTVTATVSEETVQDVLKGIELLNLFTTEPRETNLTKFKEAFYERYEEQEIPLLQVLDTESGIGYLQQNTAGDVSPLVDDIGIMFSGRNNSIQWNRIQSFLLKKYLEAVKNDSYETELTKADLESLEKFSNKSVTLPNTIAAMISIVEGKDANNPKEKIHIISAGGSSAANLLGRFCHADEDILKLTKEITQKEEELNPDKIFAEIVHLPEARTGNILLRPVLRKYEIPYLAKSCVTKEFQITPDDLMISVRNNRIMLRSKRLNKEIVPRLSTAHNYSANSLPVYHFLCDMQTQDVKAGVGFNWGALSNEYTFMPRVVYENLILSLAAWNLSKEDFKQILTIKENDWKQTVNEWRTKFKMPRYVSLADGDNELVIDLENYLCVKTLAETIKKREGIHLVEFIFNPDNAVVKGPEGSFVNQFIISYYRNEKEESIIKNEFENQSVIAAKRRFAAADEWLYFKFYCGNKTTNTILTKYVKPITKQLIAEKKIDKWFFIRYADPKNHLRVRLHCPNPALANDIIRIINQATEKYFKEGLIWKTQIDTYQRELERYDWENIELAEDLFYRDSKVIADIIEILEGDRGDKIRWLLSLRSMDMLLNDFGYNIIEKVNLFKQLKDSFGNEFGMNKNLKLQLDKKYRNNRKQVEKFLDYKKDYESEYLSVFMILKERSGENEAIAEKTKKTVTPERLDELMKSYLHMNANRIFRSRQRLHEMVVYDFLYRYYKSEIAKQKNKGVITAPVKDFINS